MTSLDALLTTIFPGESEMSRAMRRHDWAATPLGPAASWPDALRIPLAMVLTSRFEMWLGWGRELTFFYNDAYLPTLGVKHPAALGRPLREVWPEVFGAVENRITSVMRDGIATSDKALMLVLERSFYPEETYHSFSYSPLRGAAGSVEGLLCIAQEETERVIGERRLELLRVLVTALLPARTREGVVHGVGRALRSDPREFCFGFLHLFEGGFEADQRPLEQTLRRLSWPYAEIEAGRSHVLVPLGDIAGAPWERPPRQALLVELRKVGEDQPVGCLVLGLNPLRRHDLHVESFADLLAGQVAGVLATVDAQRGAQAETDRLQQMFAQSPSFMAILRGSEHRFELLNPAARTLLGGRDVLGMTVGQALPEVGDQGFIAMLDRVFAGGEPFVGRAMPVTLRLPEGGEDRRVLDFVFQPLRAGGAVSGIFVDAVDVTVAHETASALRESERQFGTLTQALPNQVWTAGTDGGLDWVNGTTLAYAGLPFDELRGDGWARSIHPDDMDRAREAWGRSLATGESYATEFRIRRADGVYRWHVVRALPLRDDAGHVLRWIGANTDIHERKMAEAENQRDLELVWTLSPVLKLVAWRDGRIEAANPSWTGVMGWSEAETVGRRLADFQEGSEEGSAGAPEYEASFRARDGTLRRIAWTMVTADEKTFGFGRDITAQRLAEDALRQAQKMEAVGQLTGGIAHDFNNLLQGITGSLDLVRKRAEQGRIGELDRFIRSAMTSAERAAALTHRLLAFSRRQPLDPRPVQVNPLLAAMADLLRRTLGERVALVLDLADGVWITRCDANQLENAVLNLAINARDAMPQGGTLRIASRNVRLEPDAATAHADARPGRYVHLAVSDDGTGMSAETMARAFEPFFTTKPLGQGTGLGLSMIYGFARQSGGHAAIASTLGGGTTVSLYLPRHAGAADEEAPAPAPAPATAAGSGETILVVEDEAVVRSLIVELLRDLGYRPLEAADGPAGLDMLRSDARIDLLITDVGLPGLNGRQVADAGRALRPGLKVVFMTGYAESAVLGSGFSAPGVALITKPFAMGDLAARVRKSLEGEAK